MDSGRKQAPVLARYGGQAGPTGSTHAGNGSPVSLANFMGGKAAGPRLGKLVGDGRSAPPEFDQIDQSRQGGGVPLPGMANKSLASFLEARAQDQGNSSSGPRSPTKAQSIQIPVADSATSLSTDSLPAPSRQTPLRGNSSSAVTAAAQQQSTSAPSSSSPPMKDAATSPNPIHTDPAPTESIHRLRGGGMVAQRLKEAKERQSSDQAPPQTSTQAAPIAPGGTNRPPSPSKWPKVNPASSLAHGASTTNLHNNSSSSGSSRPTSSSSSKWPPVISASSLATSSSTNTNTVSSSPSGSASSAALPAPSRWNPARSGNALPGLASSSPSKSSFDDNIKSGQDNSSASLSPVRLPGMGGPVSPFGANEGKSDRESSSSFFSSQDAEKAQQESTEPLQALTSNRARGPARKNPRAAPGPTETQSQSDLIDAQQSSSSSFTKTIPRTDDPTMSKLLGTPQEESVNKSIQPGSSSTGGTPSVRQVEADMKSQQQSPLRNTSGPRIAVLISGSGSNLQALIDSTHKDSSGLLSNSQISLVLSNRKAAYGLERAKQSNPPIPTEILAFKTWQNKNGGQGTREEYDQVLAKTILDEGKPDMIVLAGFMHIVSPEFLHALGHTTDNPTFTTSSPSWRPKSAIPIINLHPALPHAFDGINAIERAYEAYQQKEIKYTGVMVHEVVAQVDRGEPIVIEQVAIRDKDTLEQLQERIHTVEHRLIVRGTRITLDKLGSK
ncbi:unnamed protein product [Sympodiomycopsis kandeliae]